YFKVSLRSVELIDVSAIAQKFGGGGHARSAGCSFTCPYEEIERTVVSACSEALGQAGVG
ncbi:MAG: bifunctional oligoribonuclease/PAP phosphatase NrnA, partial [Oscillospiraceae bacterium]